MTPVTAAAAHLHVDLRAGRPPLLQVDAGDGVAPWADAHRDALLRLVAQYGAVLVRGLNLRDAGQTEAVFRRLGTLMVEREGFAARKRYADGVYSSSKWPQNQMMCMHHELSYALEVPGMMMFACLVAPAAGGATPVADAQAVLAALPHGLVERFQRVGWLLVRNYSEDVGTTIEEAFGTDDPDDVERYCRANSIEFEWREGGALRTWQRRRAVVPHPVTGGRCWFNQVAFLNAWTMDPEVREYLTEVYGVDALPFDTRFGDGDPIGPEVVLAINHAYAANTVREPWQPGDLLVVDNIGTAHGREGFEGPREVVVALADPVRVAEEL